MSWVNANLKIYNLVTGIDDSMHNLLILFSQAVKLCPTF